jgi:colicin import membrane protein
MSSATLTRDTFMPRAPRGMGPGLALALLVHVLLVTAIAFSVNWRASSPAVAEAELWAAVPQVAAPRAAEPVPPKPLPPQPVKPPPPVPRAEPEPQKLPDASIAIEKAKREEAAKREQKDELERKKKAEQERKADEALVEARERNIKRILGQAEATGGAESKGTAAQSKGPSDSYGGRVKARVKPNIVFADAIDGNPVAEVEVRCAPDGTIVSRKLVKSSGVKGWDEAVLRAIDKTEILPRDIDGRVPSSLTLVFSPRD